MRAGVRASVAAARGVTAGQAGGEEAQQRQQQELLGAAAAFFRVNSAWQPGGCALRGGSRRAA
jgi:hypothetical protein